MSKIKFNINYNTNFGEEIFICGSIPELGNMDISKAQKLNYNNKNWTLTISTQTVGALQYFYFIKEHSIISRTEWGEHRRIHITKSKDYSVNDYWKDEPFHNYLYTAAFSKSIFAHKTNSAAPRYFNNSLVLNIICPYAKSGQHLVLSGKSNYLGNWDLQKAIPLNNIGDAVWQVIINTKNLQDETEYKFVIVDSRTKEAIYWEYGENRMLQIENKDQTNLVQVEMAMQFNYESFHFKGSGTAIPVFSLRSNDSFGIGDFYDLKKMVDWVSLTNQQMIQILPINDTTTTGTWTDSYPYNAISSYALHPIYLGLSQFPIKDKLMLKQFEQEAEELNQLQFLDYKRVYDLKRRYTKQLFVEQGNDTISSKEFKDFYVNNKSWLFPYSVFCYLRDKHNTAHFPNWRENATYNESKIKQLLKNNPTAKSSFNYYCFVQFLLDKQLKETTAYAHSKGVSLKGDIPIGINRDSIEAWTAPHLFNLDTQTGAPPDDFSVFGQNWGFPTYNWKVMESENYNWWRNRFQKMEDYFDAYRIDHILGFFRIWEIPLHSVQGLLGHFSPAMPYHAEELRMAGIAFDEQRMTKPFIHQSFLNNLFGEYTEEVIENYLNEKEDQLFNLKEEVDTQRKIQQLFLNYSDEKSEKIRDGLYALCNEVLFVRDRTNDKRFHPRITAYNTYSYKFLDENTRTAFYNLYEDFFYHRHNYFWSEEAMKKLPALISSTKMLCCGEDLGMVPDCVPSVMNKLGILSLEIQRMPKEYNTAFSNLGKLPYLSVSTTSTHDMSPIRLWWKENRDATQNYYNNILNHRGEAPHDCTPQICKEIMQLHIQSSSMWVVLPLQDWMSVSAHLSNTNPADDRINIPSNPRHYWRWRMHITLEELINDEDFNKEIQKISLR